MEPKTQLQQRLLAFSQGNLRDNAQSRILRQCFAPTRNAEPATRPPFSLIYRGVMSKKHSVAFPNQVPSFNPIGEREFKMVCER